MCRPTENGTFTEMMALLLKGTHADAPLHKDALAEALTDFCQRSFPRAWGEKEFFFSELASYHGVAPLFFVGCKGVCDQKDPCHQTLLTQLQTYHAYILQRNMRMAAELITIMNLFKAHDIPMMAFKGPTLAVGIYGDLSLRQFGDLDILVRPQDIDNVMKLLSERGYVPDVRIPEEEASHYYALLTTIGFDKPDMRIEIHWELLSKNYAIGWKSESLWQRVQTVRINRQKIPTLGVEDQLLYLCLHGSKHLFERLEWVCDIDRSIRASQPLDWESLAAHAKAMGVYRMLLLGISLASDFYETPLPRFITESIAADRVLPSLKDKILDTCYRKKPGVAVDHRYLPLLLKMRERPADKMRFLWQALFATQFNDLNYVRLPRYLRFFYPLVRLYRLAQKYLKKSD